MCVCINSIFNQIVNIKHYIYVININIATNRLLIIPISAQQSIISAIIYEVIILMTEHAVS